MTKYAPLHASFMIASMLGMVASVLVVYPAYKGVTEPYGASFALIFFLMFVASSISFIYAPIEEYPHRGMEKYD